MSEEKQGTSKETRGRLYVEDALILVSIGLLFWLGVVKRHQPVAQVLLGAVFIIMLVVFVRRIRRTYRAFKEKRDER